jgi:hypothetical protein
MRLHAVGLTVSGAGPLHLGADAGRPVLALVHRTETEQLRSKSDGDLPRSTSVPRLAAYGCAPSVQDAGLRRGILTHRRRLGVTPAVGGVPLACSDDEAGDAISRHEFLRRQKII